MNAFEVLGIPFTKDIKEIRRAYSKLLTQFSPEKDPEGFQRLRSAYEEAIAEANETKEATAPILSPLDEFMKAFEENYRCFEKRLDMDSWRYLLERDICYNIDSSKEVSSRILTFLMNDYNFTTEVWKLFDSYFSWTAKKDSLYNKFPTNFIDFVVYKINNESTFNYEYLRKCKDNEQDKFIEEYRRLSNAIDQYDLYTVHNSAAAAKELCPGHPDLRVLIGRYYSISGRIEEAISEFGNLIEEDDGDLNAFFYRAEVYFKIGKLMEAYDDYKRVLDIKQDSPGAWFALAKCCLCLKKYEEAIEYSEKLDSISEYRQDIHVILNSAYNFYIQSLKEQAEQEQLSAKVKLKLAEAYFKTAKFEDSYNILVELVQSAECTADMYVMLCRVLVEQKNMELAYTNISKAEQLFDGNYELSFLKADILDDLGKLDESVKQYDRAIELKQDYSSAYNNKAYVLNKLKRYNEALECADMAIRLDSSAAVSYKNKAGALLGLELYEECLQACEQALSKYQYLTEAYVIKMKAFIDMNLLQEALGVYNKASDWGLKDNRLYYEKARTLMYMRKYSEAIEYCDLVLQSDENNADCYYIKGLCYYYDDNYNNAIEAFDNSIKQDPYYGAAYYYKIKSLEFDSKDREALEEANKAIGLNLMNSDRFYALRAGIFDRLEKYEEAIEDYKKAIDEDPNNARYYYMIGRALNDIEKYEEAIEYHNKSFELDPNVKEGYISMSYSLYNLGRYKECIVNCDKAIGIDSEYTLAHQNKGWALFKLNCLKEAEEECSIALQQDGSNKDVLILKVRILTQKGLNQEALIVCDRILELDPSNENIRSLQRELFDKLQAASSGAKEQKKGLFKSLFK